MTALSYAGGRGIQAGLLAAAFIILPLDGAVLAQDERTAAENSGRDEELDSEHLFGFTEGSDVGAPGEKELEQETTGRIGKRGGTFRAFDPTLALKVPLTNNFRLAPGLSFYGYDIALGSGLPARTSGGFNGAFLETRVRLLDRRTAPIGLTFNIVPSFVIVNTGSGLRSRSYGTEAGVLMDRELIPGNLIADLNLSYYFASTSLISTNEREHDSGLEVSGALAYHAQPGLFLGGEIRYARAYDGLAVDHFAGDALYFGPTLYRSLSEHSWASFIWSFQVAGRAVGDRGPLDLTNFDRHQLRLRIGYSI